MNQYIDIVIPWVDGSDIEWQKEKAKYGITLDSDSRANRYRDWDILQYLFRGIEQFAPWVRFVFFITWGHLPCWLNTQHEKLKIVDHAAFIPEEYLPTFSANPIEMNLHRIEELSEYFVYFNDDTFLISPTTEQDFFKNSLPCDCLIEGVQYFNKGRIDPIVANDLMLLNANFSKKNSVRKYWTRWFSPRYKKGMLKNLYLLPFEYFTGFVNPHIPTPFLKSTFKEIWDKEFDFLDETCKHKFRSNSDVNQWLARYWQFASGRFSPRDINMGKFFSIGKDDSKIEEAILNQKYKTICLSDDEPDIDFEYESNFLGECLHRILPSKSAYEK